MLTASFNAACEASIMSSATRIDRNVIVYRENGTS
jgi:hypothetical protein